VSTQGHAAGGGGFSGTVRTDAQGRYKFQAHAEQAYAITASMGEWVAAPHTDLFLPTGQALEDVDFQLTRATRLHGRIKVTGSAYGLRLVTIAVDLRHAVAKKSDFNDGAALRSRPISFYASPDNEGHYELFLAPGEYEVRVARQTEPIQLSIPAINPPEAIERNFTLPNAEIAPFVTRVADAQGKRVQHAIISAYYASYKAGRMLNGNRTDARGEMKFDRELRLLVMHAQSGDKQQAGVARFAAELSQGDVVVHPVATATGCLTDQAGNIMSNQQLSYGIRIPLADGPFPNYSMDRFGGMVTTDAEGCFRLDGLVVKEPYHLVLHTDGGTRWELKEIKADAPGMLELGTIEVNRAQLVPVR
jgi:hypothetical protein